MRARVLEAAGGPVFLVGGTLRDVLLEREPADFDFAVTGSGIACARDFSHRAPGKLVILSEKDDEARVIASKRVFDFNGFGEGTIAGDLARRDFTINAMACEVRPDGVGDLLDPHSGRQDLASGIIRPVSDSSLASDPLRLLRAFRLALELGMTVDEAVLEQGSRASLARTAGERVNAELLRTMERPGAHDCLQRLHDIGRLAEILPGFEPILEDDRLRGHSFRTLFKLEEMIHGESFFSRFEPEWERYFEGWRADEEDGTGLPFRRAMLKLGGLLHDIAKPQTRFQTTSGETHFYGHDSLGARMVERLGRKRLKLSRPQLRMLGTLVQEHMRLHLLATSPDLTDRAVRRFFRDLGEDAFGMMMLCYADGWATAGKTYHLEDTITRMIEQKREEDAKLAVERFITGHDLIAAGLKPGPAFKVILQELEDLQVEGKINSREEGLEYLKANMPGLNGEAQS